MTPKLYSRIYHTVNIPYSTALYYFSSLQWHCIYFWMTPCHSILHQCNLPWIIWMWLLCLENIMWCLIQTKLSESNKRAQPRTAELSLSTKVVAAITVARLRHNHNKTVQLPESNKSVSCDTTQGHCQSLGVNTSMKTLLVKCNGAHRYGLCKALTTVQNKLSTFSHILYSLDISNFLTLLTFLWVLFLCK